MVFQSCICTGLSIFMVILFVNRKYLFIVNPIFIVFYISAGAKGISKAPFIDLELISYIALGFGTMIGAKVIHYIL